MDQRITGTPQRRLFASTAAGVRLPVLDITHPAFSVPQDDEMPALSAAALRDEEARGPVQRLFIRLVLAFAARRSRLVAALQKANRGYLSGLPTYVMKLGPDNLLPPYDSPLDRAMLKSPTVTSMRVRLHQVAHLLADALASELAARPDAPLEIIDIAGGPSADALNALLLLNQLGLLAGRQARITIYDIDADGPAFAAAMLAALKSGPLAGREVSIVHRPGNWQDVGGIERVLDQIIPDGVLAASSEGGLFEYGSDAEIVAVLTALAPRVPIVTGSVTRDDRLQALLRRSSKARTVPRGLERFSALAESAGYEVRTSRPAPLSDQVLLVSRNSLNAASRR
jgi:hypothetical protein